MSEVEKKQAEENEYLKKIYFDNEYNLWDECSCKDLKEKESESSERPMFSFMMCTYNDASILNAAINSLLTQSCEDWELVILDNSDKSEEPWRLIQNAMAMDSRIRGYRSEENYGWPKGASLCMEHIKGRYTTFLAADDCINQGALAYMHKLLSEKAPDILWVSAASTIYDKAGSVTLGGLIQNTYREFDAKSRSQNIVDIMRGTYYNSFFHYMNVDFLRANNINFYEPYYADCGGMTKALAVADSMVVTDQIIYFLTSNTSQTKGKYTWDSYDFEFANQWESVKEVFIKENYLIKVNVSYVAHRILKNMFSSVANMLKGRCRNKYMNPVEKSAEEILEQLEAVLENAYVQEMLVLAGKQLRKYAFDILYDYLLREGQNELLINKPMLKLLKQLFLSIAEENVAQRVEAMSRFLLLTENKVFLGFTYFAELLEECPDEVLLENQERIESIIEAYSKFLDLNNKTAEEQWYVKVKG